MPISNRRISSEEKNHLPAFPYALRGEWQGKGRGSNRQKSIIDNARGDRGQRQKSIGEKLFVLVIFGPDDKLPCLFEA
jgi:hypothetical protein